MWFLFGAVTLVTCIVYFYNQKIGLDKSYRNFSQDRIDGLNYFFSYSAPKKINLFSSNIKNGYWLEVALECPSALRFNLKPETKLDSWAKKLKVSVEPQTNNAEFNRLFYSTIENESSLFAFNNSTITNQFIEVLYKSCFDNFLLKKGQVGKFTKATLTLVEIKSNGEYLAASFKLSDQNAFMDSLRIELARTLLPISKIIKNYPEKHGYKWWEDSLNQKCAFLLSLSSSFAILGYVELFRLYTSSQQTVVINFAPLNYVWLGTIPIVIFISLIIVWITLKKTTRTHLIMKEMLITGGIGLLAYSYSLIYDINIAFDKSASLSHQQKVSLLKTHRTTGKRARTYYKTCFNNMPLHVPDCINVTSSFYYSLKAGDHVMIKIKNGVFGANWIEDISKTNN